MIHWLITGNAIGTVGGYLLERFWRREFELRITLDAEKAKTDAPLQNILPHPIAERLKAGPALIACTGSQTQLCEGNGDCSPLSCLGAMTPLFGYGLAVCR